MYEIQKSQDGEKRTGHGNMLMPCEMLELESEHTPNRSAATTPATTRSKRVTSASSRAASSTPAITRSISRRKTSRTADGVLNDTRCPSVQQLKSSYGSRMDGVHEEENERGFVPSNMSGVMSTSELDMNTCSQVGTTS